MLDYIIKNGVIVNGKNEKPFQMMLGIKGTEIAEMKETILTPAAYVIDAGGAFVTPGFIDIHRHADVQVLNENFGEAELRQGLTTIVNGNCGLSAVPCAGAHREEILAFLESVIGRSPASFNPGSFEAYMERLACTKLAVNTGMTVGNGTIRAAVKGYASGQLDAGELSEVHSLLRRALDAGALGVTLGIVYAPEYNYRADDFVRVLEPMRAYGVPLTAHIRGEGDTLCESVREVIDIAKQLAVPLHISHLKCIGSRNWGHKAQAAAEIIEAAKNKGMDIDFDVYPYTFGSTQLIQILPPECLEGGTPGIIRRLRDKDFRKYLTEVLKAPSDRFENLLDMVGFENILVGTLSGAANKRYEGMSLRQIAQLRQQDPYECTYDLLIEENCNIAMVDYITSLEDVKGFIKHPLANIISDSVYPEGGRLHPRLFAAFPKVLIDFVRDEGFLKIEEAVYKMTGRAAAVYRLKKGVIEIGADADLNIFKLENLKADADFEHPTRCCKGFDYVFVNGVPAVMDDRLTGKRAGKAVIRER